MAQPTLHHRKLTRQGADALRVTAAVFGVYGGLLGCEHGFFEARQGNSVPASARIMAVRGKGLLFPFGHEPALTIVPDYLLTGILAMVLGFAIIVWSSMFVQRKHGALVLALLSLVLFLCGGGFGPISLLIAAVLAASQIGERSKSQRQLLPAAVRRALATLWPWMLGAALGWVPFELVLGLIFHLSNDPRQALTNLNLVLSYPLLTFFALTLVTAFARRAQESIDTRTQDGAWNSASSRMGHGN